MKKISISFFLLMFTFSCFPDKKRNNELIYKESSAVFIDAYLGVIMKGYSLNADSLLKEYTCQSAKDAELGLVYAYGLREYQESLSYVAEK